MAKKHSLIVQDWRRVSIEESGIENKDAVHQVVDESWDHNRDEMESNVDEIRSLLHESDEANEPPRPNRNNGVQNVTSYEDALEACGCGKFHIILLLLCGWAVSSDAIEVISVSFLLPSASCDLSLTSSDKGFLNSVVFLGMMFGGYIWGSLADKWGRRNILMWSLMINGVGNLVSSVTRIFWLFLFCRFISGAGVGGSMPVVFTYFTEFQHKSCRGAMISFLATFWMSGNIVVAGLAWIVIPREYLSFVSGDFIFNSWRVFVAICTIPSISSAAFFILMPESPKFLLKHGKQQQAVSILYSIHKMNKSAAVLQIENLALTNDAAHLREMESFPFNRRSSNSHLKKFKEALARIVESTLAMFRKPLLRTTLVLLSINFTIAFGYYGVMLWIPELFSRIDKYGGSFCDLKPISSNITINDTTDCDPPSTSIYRDSFIMSLSTLPGNVVSILLVEKTGRKAMLASSVVFTGVSVFFFWLVQTRWQRLLMSCIFAAVSVAAFNMLDILQAELFPTDVRSTAFGVQAAALRTGAILGNTLFGQLMDVHCFVPLLVASALLSFGGLASFFLPNTTGVDIH